MSAPQSIDPVLKARLDALQHDSEARSAELREIAARLPAVVGRRAMIRTLLGDFARNPNKAEIARRGWARVLQVPRDLWTRLRARLWPSA